MTLKLRRDSARLSRGCPAPWLVAVAALAVAACTAEIPHLYKDEGKLCIYPIGAIGHPTSTYPRSYSYAADASFSVVVAFEGCLSGSCSRDIVTSCSVAGIDGELQVTSKGSYVKLDEGACDTDCKYFSAKCTTPELAAGDHVFHHGADTLVLPLPSEGAAPCTGQIEKP